MATKHGKDGIVKLGATGGTATVLQLKGWSYEEKIDEADSSVAGASGKTSLAGLKSWSGTIDVLDDLADTGGQGTLTIGAEVTVNFYDDSPDSGEKYRIGSARVNSVGKDLKIDGVITRKYGLSGQGVMSDGTV
jgi:hypothetical protein